MSHTPVPGPCRAFLNDFSAFVDGEISSRRRDEIQAHVDCCQACLDHLTAYRRGITVLRSIESEAPDDFWTRLEQRLWLGPELSVLEGGKGSSRDRRGTRWPSPAVSLAAAAVLGLFVLARGLGPGARPVQVGPERIQASVAVTLPKVPESGADTPQALALAGSRTDGPAVRASRRSASGSAPVERASERIDFGGEGSIERESGRFEERVFTGGLRSGASTLAADGWVQPVRLGGDRWRTGLQPATLVRTAASVTPAPWNVDRAVGLP